MKLEFIRLNLTLDETRREAARWWTGRPNRVAKRHPLVSPRGPLWHTRSLINYLPNFMIFSIKFRSVVAMCLPHTYFPV
jgi:hypothetical protein